MSEFAAVGLAAGNGLPQRERKTVGGGRGTTGGHKLGSAGAHVDGSAPIDVEGLPATMDRARAGHGFLIGPILERRAAIEFFNPDDLAKSRRIAGSAKGSSELMHPARVT